MANAPAPPGPLILGAFAILPLVQIAADRPRAPQRIPIRLVKARRAKSDALARALPTRLGRNIAV